jgi:hypothetical protein
MTYTVARMNGQWVHVMRFDWEQPNRRRSHFRWVPASTRFDAVREFVGA